MKDQTNTTKPKYKRLEKANLLSSSSETAYLFACRYVHNRNTGGTLAITVSLAEVWDKMSILIKTQIEREAKNEATTNRQDWANFFGWSEDEF